MSRERAKKPRGAAGTIVFYSIYFVLLAAALSAAAAGLGKLWEFLQHYESCQIYHATDALTRELNSGDISRLCGGVEDTVSPYENGETVRRQLSERFTGDFSLKRNIKESTKENPVYTISCAGEPVGFARLTVTGHDELYGFEIFGVERVYGVRLVQNERVALELPSGCTAKINGVELSEYSAHSTAEIKEAAHFGEYLANAPKLESYTVDGLMYQPEVEFCDRAGKPLEAVRDDSGAYACGLPTYDAETAKQAGEFALEFSELYSRYIANDAYFSSLSGYIPESAELYNTLKTYEGQFYTYHSGYDFTSEQVKSVTQYSDTCFAVRVSYDHEVYYGGETFTYPADNTIFAVSTGQGWRAVDLIMN